MTKRHLLYEGKAKKVYDTTDKYLVIQEFKDDATAFNAQKKGSIVGKGVVNNQISSTLFSFLESESIKTHFVKMLSDREMLCKRLDIFKIEVVTRNICAGSLVKRYGLTEGTALTFPVVELYLKEDALGDPFINDDLAIAMGLGSIDEITFIKSSARKVNELLSAFFLKRGLLLVDFKLEYGRSSSGEILLGDEISPDTCRLWDSQTRKKLDKDRFRFDLGDVEESYQEVKKRITL